MNSAVSFARIWNHMAVSWSQLPAGFPCVFIKYEDLISGNFDFRKLESWLGIEIRENARTLGLTLAVPLNVLDLVGVNV